MRTASIARCALLLAAAAALQPAAALAGANPAPVRVLAASSLKEAFGQVGARFTARTGLAVELQLAGSQELRTQIEHGAPFSAFAAADTRHMQALRAAGLVRPQVLFASNELVLVVPPGNPAGVRTLRDLAGAVRLVVGAPDVPVGTYTARLLERAEASFGAGFKERVERRVVSRELNVRQVLAKVALGEADAGVVYRTDARAFAGKVLALELPPELNLRADYPIAAAAGAAGGTGQRFVEFVAADPEARRLLVEAGFGPPAAERAP